jgi:phosphoribosylaminoimidazolecarboxamide formyltransferase/IMP cyclohydrolase
VRAVLSASDKRGLDQFARGLVELGFEIFATDGTASMLRQASVPVRTIGDLTGHPEMLGGRVKTLHPAIHAGLLADREDRRHLTELAEHGYEPIHLVAVNLYPFQSTIESPEVSLKQAIEQVDIGGVTLLRAASKNFAHVVPVVDPADYPEVIERLGAGTADFAWRRQLASKGFRHVAAYDTHVADYLLGTGEDFPDTLTVALTKLQDLRYGENPHQRAALYRESLSPHFGATLAGARQLHGRELSFNNVLDVGAALGCVRDFAATTVAIIKHGNPCGLASAAELPEAYQRAHAGDPLSAFGGAVGLNRMVDRSTAELIANSHYDDIVAPGYAEDALPLLRRRRNLRVLEVDFAPEHAPAQSVSLSPRLDFRQIDGGFLVQTPDALGEEDLSWRVVTERQPTTDEGADLRFAWCAVKHVRSNAIVLARQGQVVGVGAGQMSRVDSVDIAIRKAGARAAGSVLASDAFFSHPDGPELAAKAGVSAIIQPGGSLRDQDVVDVANRYDLSMVYTGQRHFRH